MLLKIKLSSFIGETFNQPPTITALLLLNKQKYLEVSNMHACMGKAKHFLRGEEERYQGGEEIRNWPSISEHKCPSEHAPEAVKNVNLRMLFAKSIIALYAVVTKK